MSTLKRVEFAVFKKFLSEYSGKVEVQTKTMPEPSRLLLYDDGVLVAKIEFRGNKDDGYFIKE